MKDKNLEKAAKDEESSLNEENKISTNSFNNISEKDQKKPDIRDIEEQTSVGIEYREFK